MMQTGRLTRLGGLCASYQGEVNETTEGGKGSLSRNEADGQLVLRGANISLYALREASQGEAIYLNVAQFLRGKGAKSKAFHGRSPRLGFQRSSPQNNFRRIIACMIPAGNYCFDTVSYIPYSETQVEPYLLLALLNSKLLDWYFRLGSSNSKVNEYQFNILPCPVLSRKVDESDDAIRHDVQMAIAAARWVELPKLISPYIREAPFGKAAAELISDLSRRICEIEAARGVDLSRFHRSSLAEEAQPLQDVIDAVLFKMAGFSEVESRRVEESLGRML